VPVGGATHWYATFSVADRMLIVNPVELVVIVAEVVCALAETTLAMDTTSKQILKWRKKLSISLRDEAAFRVEGRGSSDRTLLL